VFYAWKPYVRVAERRKKAAREMDKLRKKGSSISPVIIEGRAIAKTFWGKAWCNNLERYSDYANRLPRGRTYVRNGSVVDLQMGAGEVTARVAGSSVYRVKVVVTSVPKARWNAICRDCSGAIDSLVELLQGRFSERVMERICREKTGLFPSPGEIKFGCSCPDWATMCKHVAAVLYGIGARLDEKPELMFHMRKVDEKALIARAGQGLPLAKSGPRADRILGDEVLSEVFGIEMARRAPRVPKGRKNRSGSALPRGAVPASRLTANQKDHGNEGVMGRRRIREDDLRGQSGLSREAIAALIAAQPSTVREALAIGGVGRKTTRRLLRLGCVTDLERIQHVATARPRARSAKRSA